MSQIGVVGAGSWGTALASLLAKKGNGVQLWAYESQVAKEIQSLNENSTYLSDIKLPSNLQCTTDMAQVLNDAEIVVSVSPSQFVGDIMNKAVSHMRDDALVVSASKGIEASSLRRMDEVLSNVLKPSHMKNFSVLSGPSFAREVALEEPTAVVVASQHQNIALQMQELFQTNYFRVYIGDDVIGVELAGAIKNVIALGAGVTVGLGFGINTMSALVTRGLAEIRRLGMAMGAKPETFSGLAGIGDLLLTCTGSLSRNRSVGLRLGQGENLASILKDMNGVAEGVNTTKAVYDLAKHYQVEMPITEEIYGILMLGTEPRKALQNLMERDPKPEEWH